MTLSTAEELTLGIGTLEDDEILAVLQDALAERTGVIQAFVNWAVPTVVCAPTRAITENRQQGTIKSYSEMNGYGFIECPEVHEAFSCDVFMHGGQLPTGMNVGTNVTFAVLVNKDQKPQAFDIQKYGADAHKGKGAWKGGGDEWRGDAGKGSWGNKGGGENWHAPAKGSWGKGGGDEWSAPKGSWGKGGGDEWSAPKGAWGKGGKGGLMHPMAGAAKGGKGWANGPPTPPQAWAAGGKPSSQAGKTLGAMGGEMEGVTDRRFEGSVKSFNYNKGFGFIISDELQEKFEGADVFVHHQQIGDYHIGDLVSFSVILGRDQKPQAIDLEPAGAAGGVKRPRHSL